MRNIFNLTPVVDAAHDFLEKYTITARTVYEDVACTPDSFLEDEIGFSRAECFMRNATPKLNDSILGPECSVPSPPTKIAYELVLAGQGETSAKYIEFMFDMFLKLSNVTVHYYCSGSPRQLHVDTGRGQVTAPYDLSCGNLSQRQSLHITLDGISEKVVNLNARLMAFGEGHLYLTEVQSNAPRRGMYSGSNCCVII